MLGTAAGDWPITGRGSGGLGRAGATLACGERVSPAPTVGEARAQFAAHPGEQRFKTKYSLLDCDPRSSAEMRTTLMRYPLRLLMD